MFFCKSLLHSIEIQLGPEIFHYRILAVINTRDLRFVARPPVWAFSRFQILCSAMGNHIRSVAHPLLFLNLTLFSAAHITKRIQYIGRAIMINEGMMFCLL